jgi:hypothetical protein
MPTLIGALAPRELQPDAIQFGNSGTTRSMTFTTQGQLTLFERLGIIENDIESDALGLYSRMTFDQNLEARVAWFNSMGYGLFSDLKGCSWHPKGGLSMNMDRFGSCAIQSQGQQCPDALWKTCFQQFFGPGREVRDVFSSPELSALMAQLLRLRNRALGNSFFQLVHFNQHPIIEQANTDETWRGKQTPQQWTEYYDQMMNPRIPCAGIVTTMDQLVDDGYTGYSEIPDSDVSGSTYTGDPTELFDSMRADAQGEFADIVSNGYFDNGGQRRWPVFLVSRSIFRAYKQWIKDNFPTLPQTYKYTLTGMDGDIINVHNLLEHDGFAVKVWEESERFDALTGWTSHRAALVTPGVFGIGYDIPSLEQFDGMGTRVVQKLDPPDNGMVYMDTALRFSTALIDPSFAVYRRNI